MALGTRGRAIVQDFPSGVKYMIPKIVSVVPLDDFKLFLSFDPAETRVYDARPWA